MPLTPRQAFKAAYLLRCAEAGLSLEQIEEKAAADLQQLQEKAANAGGVLATGLDNALTGSRWGLAAAIAAPPILGYLGGNMLGKFTDADSEDVAEAQQQEVLSELRRSTQQLRQNQAARAARNARQAPGARSF